MGTGTLQFIAVLDATKRLVRSGECFIRLTGYDELEKVGASRPR
jgi:hypothetical protein